jgi:organic radical activating enzyme
MIGTHRDSPLTVTNVVSRGLNKVKRVCTPTQKYPKQQYSQGYPYKWCALIDITNYCSINNCIYCSRFLNHVPEHKRYNMSLDKIEEAIIAYKGFPEHLGIIGGEPQIYPQFKEMCELLLKHNKREKYCFFTSINPETSKYRDLIKKTFGYVAYNPHTSSQSEICKHQPLTLAAKDMVQNQNLRYELYDQCYFRQKWCGTVNPMGAFHCEIAAGIALLMGKKGLPVKKNWWLGDWHDQIDLCELCGGAIPQERQLMCNKTEKISSSVIQLLKENNCVLGQHEVIAESYTIEYIKQHAVECPGAYRADKGELEQPTVKIDWKKYEANKA